MTRRSRGADEVCGGVLESSLGTASMEARPPRHRGDAPSTSAPRPQAAATLRETGRTRRANLKEVARR